MGERARRGSVSGVIALAAVSGVVFLTVLSTAPEDALAKPTKPKPKPSATPAAPARTAAAPVRPGERWKIGPSGSACAARFSSEATSGENNSRECATTDTCCIQTLASNGQISLCVDLKADWRNCGGCGRACQSDETCSEGMCGCGSGELRCNGKCTSPKEDAANCGACGKKCPQMCSAGRCATCRALGRGTYCGDVDNGECVTLDSDDSNCGKCGRACTDGRTCTHGACRY